MALHPPKLSDARNLWDRLSGESSKAFEAFQIYRDMGPSRSFSKVSGQLHKHVQLLSRWSRRWRWQERLYAYETYLDQERQEATLKAQQDMVQRHMKESLLLQQKVMEVLPAYAVNNLTFAQLLRALDLGIRHERLARGLPEEE